MSRYNYGGAYSNAGAYNDPYAIRTRDPPSSSGNDGTGSLRNNSANNDPAPGSLRSPPMRSPARDRRAGGYGGYGGMDTVAATSSAPSLSSQGRLNGAGPERGGTPSNDDYDPYSSNGDYDPYAADNYTRSRSGSRAVSANNTSNPYAAPPPPNNAYDRYDAPSESPGLPRPAALERARAKRRSDGRESPFSSGRPVGGAGYGPGSKQIEDVLRIIRADWQFLTDEKCIPVQIALQFMDSSSLGLASKYPRFKELHQQLQAALRQIVNEQHQGFNSSIGRFHSIQEALGASQARLRELKGSMSNAKTSLETTRLELVSMAKTSQNYDDMLMVLASIEHLQSIPEKLEARISEKRFLSAVELLQDALREIRKEGMDEIGALNNLRTYLSNQEHSLTDILIEELHNHLYLKSPWCENRWKQHANQHVRGVNLENKTNTTGRPLYSFLNQLDTDTIMRDDPTKNPEADSFGYVHLIVESLNALGRLDTAVETMSQRLPVELFRVVEKCSNEVDQRFPAGVRTGKEFNQPLFDFTSGSSPRAVILNDLFGTLFARFEAIAEGHRVVHEVISGITKREGTKGSSALTSGFRELWKLYQSEIRSLLHDYLATDGDAFKKRSSAIASKNVFSKNSRDRSRKMFKLRDMDNKSADLLNERNSLQNILTSSVPGLVSESKTTTDGGSIDDSTTSNGIGITDGSATGHKLLVEASVFNMAILLPPSLDFLNNLKEVVPPSSDIALSTLTSFLDDFLINVFLPQLDDTLSEMCSRAFIEADAFMADPTWQMHAIRPIFKGAIKFFILVEAFCKMLDILPHDQAFSELVISQMVTYYDKCCGWYKALLMRATPHPQTNGRQKLSASLASEGDIKAVVDEILVSNAPTNGLLDKEIAQFVDTVEGISIDEVDLVLDRRNIAGLCMLYTSTKWLANKLQQLRFISSQAKDSSDKRASERFDKQRRWTLITTQQHTEPDRVFLPLTDETASAFDGVHDSYLRLSSDVLRLLHVEMRTHLFFYVHKSLARTFQLDSELPEPDPEIVALNADLVGFDEELALHLQPAQHVLITRGVAGLLDSLLVAASQQQIKAMNDAGCKRMSLNILVLQQNLKNIEPDAALARASRYFEMFAAGPDSVIAAAKGQGRNLGFSYGEMKALLQLCYSDALRSDRREIVVGAERGLEDRMLQLSEFLW